MEESGTYTSAFYPMQLAVVTVGDNPFAAAWWMPISKEPFRFAIAVDRGNHSLGLLREHGEAALNLLPFAKWKKVVRTGYASGRDGDKARLLGLKLGAAQRLRATRLALEAETSFELSLDQEVDTGDADHALFLFSVLAVHGERRPREREPILFLGGHDLAPVGPRVRHRIGARRSRG